VVKACEAAFIHDVISKLPNGYHTMVGESGSQLSGGQKQRIAIARAIIKNPRVLLLDEATSALDRHSEMIVQLALKNAMEGRTVVTIAHRLATIQDCDIICFIQPRRSDAPPDSPESTSRLLECGSHQELMELNGEYCAMVLSQSQAVQSPIAEFTSHAPAPGATPQADVQIPIDSALETAADLEAAEAKAKQKAQTKAFRRTAKMNSPEAWSLTIGVAAAAAVATTYSLYALIVSQITTLFYQPDVQSQVWKWCLLFVGLGFLNLIGYTAKVFFLNHAGEKLTCRLRRRLFRALAAQEMAFYDMPGNESGTLCCRLAADTTMIQHVWGGALGTNVEAAVCLGASLITAFVVSWELALVVLSIAPAVILAGYCNNQLMLKLYKKTGEDEELAAQVANESIVGSRTVFAFNIQKYQLDRYDDLLSGPAKADAKKAAVSGFFIGFSQFVTFAAFALSFWYGAKMVGEGRLDFTNLLRCSFALLLGAMGVGEVYSMAGDQAGAKAAALRVFELLDRVPAIDSMGDGGVKIESAEGYGSFHNVGFAYPTRPAVPVLKRLNLEYSPGQRIAVMGATGSGKSTIISLLMRYYDPTRGTVDPEGMNIKELNLRRWRACLGIVSQEPVLFDGTIAHNIRYGKTDATDLEVCEAAHKAHIHDLIMSLPQGYGTNVGPKGSQLSGGQKQRVAIARAIIRKPAILLLDEATSALDNVSEREVQNALDQIVMAEGMTVITVAHRFTTIKNSNVIVIVDEGRILEIGSHEELYALGGQYWRRYNQYYGIHCEE